MIFIGHTASFKVKFSKVQDFENFELSPLRQVICLHGDIAHIIQDLKCSSLICQVKKVKNDYFFYFSPETYVVGTQKNHLNEMVLLSIQFTHLNLFLLNLYLSSFEITKDPDQLASTEAIR